MNIDSRSLSPWAHTRAKEWIDLIFERSNLIQELEHWVNADAGMMNSDQQRLLSTILLILGHREIWPEDQRPHFDRLVTRVFDLRKKMAEGKQSLSVEQHKRQSTINADLELELELLKRRAGLSKRVNKIEKPKSWKRFWN